MLSVYTRHSADCARSGDGAWKRCKCPKWVWGTLNDEFIRRSAKTRSWEHAEEFRRSLEQQAQAASSASYAIVPAQPVHIATQAEGDVLTRKKIKFAVDKYLSDAKSRGLEKSTLSKLENTSGSNF